MKRKLSVAMSLVGSPPVLVMDEPTSGMDPEKKEELWQVLRTLRAQGGLILLVTQQMEEAELLADRAVLLSEGDLLSVGRVSALMNSLTPSLHLSVIFSSPRDLRSLHNFIADTLKAFPWVASDYAGSLSTLNFLIPL